ncbi:MAG: radical SAM family heme chaperone HemW, partial [Burkholderiales bacterium]|nr:radical SAM family heme chaperone HemW [Phycisphaerae bacterium]
LEAHATERPLPSPRTVFFGGGTPSLLPIDAMRRLIIGLKQRFDLSRVDEWTIEVNPATANLEYLQMLRELGIDRLSFGAQSFDPAELKMLERHHDPDDVVQSITLARQAGFERLNLDLIYAIPGQSLASWDRSIRQALDLGTTHLSCYGLTYEPNTAMTVRKRLGEFTPAADEMELEMFAHVRHTLAAHGIEWYEISNYAKPGEECRHNLVYWHGGNYIGIGPSAASHVEGHRFKNVPRLADWESAVPSGDLAVIEHEILTPQQRAHEAMMLQLRLRQGVRWSTLLTHSRTLGESAGCGDRHSTLDTRNSTLQQTYAPTLQKLNSLGLINVTESGFSLTESGMNVADGIAAEFE